MFITKARHEREMAAKDAEIAELMREIARTGLALTSARDGRAIAQRQLRYTESERDGYRDDALKFRQLKSNLIPGGPKAKAKREANGASAQAVASKWEGPAYEYGTTWGPESADEPA